MDALYRQRKFGLALMFSVATIVGFFLGRLDGGEFIGAMGTILALYGAANVGQRYVEREK